MYAYFRKLIYFSTECVFAPNAYRGHARALLKDLEKIDPSVIMNIIQSGFLVCLFFSGIFLQRCVLGESLKVKETANMPTLTKCTRCGYVSSQEICKACVLLEGLNKGLPRLGIGKSSKVRRILEENNCGKKCDCNKKTVQDTSVLLNGLKLTEK